MLYENPSSIAISEHAAVQLFGEDWPKQSVIGKILRDKEGREFLLSGIFQNLPRNSTLKFDFIVPYKFSLAFRPWNTKWGNYNNKMYVKLADGYTTGTANANIRNAIAENQPNEGETPIFLHPFSKNYLYTKAANGQITGGRIEYVRLLSLAAILILTLAVINFMNLTMAQSARRSKEAGVRKVLGAVKASLRLQYIIEATLMSFIAFLIAIAATIALLPLFNQLSGKSTTFPFTSLPFVFITAGFLLLIGCLSGAYPAWYLASLHPVKSLKGIIRSNSANTPFKKTLIVFQMVITTVMIIGSITLYRQIRFLLTTNTGMSRDRVILTNLGEIKKTQLATYQRELQALPGIESVAFSTYNPMEVNTSTYGISWKGKEDISDHAFYILGATPDMIPLLGMKMASGRNFDWNIKSDSANFLINEAAAEIIGIKNPIGLNLTYAGGGQIIGVVKNFNNQSLHSPIKPMIITWTDSPWTVLVKAGDGQLNEALASLEQMHNQYSPERTFQHIFMDDLFEQQYQSEQLLSKVALYFTIVAIIISCLGLLSLVAFTTELKTKEIGIRKVLGASLGSLLMLIGKEFVLLITLAFALAIPVASFLLNNWLEGFAYHIQLGFGVFMVTAAVAWVLTMLTVGGHILRSARQNPVVSLRDE